MSIDGTVTVQKPNDSSEDTSSLIANGWYGSSDRVDGGGSAGDTIKYSAEDNKAKLTIKNGNFSGKSGAKSMSTIKNDDYGYLYIYDGTFNSTTNSGESNAATLLNWNIAHIYGGTFTGQYPISNGAYNNSADQGLITIEGGTFTGTSSLNGNGKGGNGKGKVTITGGIFSGDIVSFDKSGGYTFEISGGAFNKNLTTYKAQNAVVVTLSDDTYKYGVLSSTPTVSITPTEGLSKDYDGQSITLTATPSATKVASIDIAYTYQWKKGALDNGSDVSGATSATLALTTVAESGDYYCEVKTGSLTIRPSAVTTVTINKAKPTVTAPTEATGLTYKGSPQALVTGGTATGGTLQYVLGQDATTAPTDGYKADIPTGTNAGTYYVWYKAVATDTANYDNTEAKCVTVTIAKATPKVTAPTAKTLTYSSGSAQDLVNAGTTTGGTLQYSLDNSTYSETIPTGTNAGNYTVSYKVVGGTNYNDVAAATVEVTIAKATINPTVNIEGWTYGATASTPSVTANTGNGKVTYTYATKGASDYSETVPTNAGDYTVRAVIEATTNYDSGTSTTDFTIAKADLEVKTPTGLTATYGQTLADVTLPTADNGTWTWSDSTTNVGNVGDNKFKAQFTPTDTENYNTPAAVEVSVTVAKADSTVTAPKPITELKYTGSAQALVTAGSTTAGTLEYSIDGTNYSAEIPTGTNAGSYTVYYKVTGDDNYNDVEAASVTVTIAKVADSDITTESGGATTEIVNTTDGKTNSKTSKTTTFTLGSGTDAITMSADVAITTEEELEAQAGSEFSTVVAVDTVLNGNKDFNQYAYSMHIVGLPSWITATGELTSSDTNAAGKTYHHEFTLKGTPTEAAEATSISFTAWVTLSSDNYDSALKASADKSVEITVAAKPVPPVAPMLKIVDASEDKSLIITADLTNGSVPLSPDVIVEATAGTNFVWIVSGDLPKYLTATSTDKALTINGYISDDLTSYSIVVIASNDVGSDEVKITFNVYKAEVDDTGAVTAIITSEDIEKIKETKGSDALTLSDIVDTKALNDTLGAEGSSGELKLSNGLTTLEGISELSNLKTLDITEVATLTTTSLTASDLGENTTEIKIGENNTSITTVDLADSKVETVTMQKSSVETLTLGNSVKTVDAKDSANLTEIDFSKSTNVQTVNISGTQVASADLSNCTELVSFSFDVAPGDGTESAGALKTLKLPETSDKLESLAVRGNQLLWLSLSSDKYPNLKNVNVRGQRRGGLSIKMAFNFLEFLWNLYQQTLHENEADYEEYTEGAEMPFDVTKISADITYVASDDNTEQKATVTDGKVSFSRTPKNFKYEYDTGFRRGGRTASTGSFITAEDEDEENGNMDVTIDTASVTGGSSGLNGSGGGGCEVGFGYGALSALMLVFATLKKRR